MRALVPRCYRGLDRGRLPAGLPEGEPVTAQPIPDGLAEGERRRDAALAWTSTHPKVPDPTPCEGRQQTRWAGALHPGPSWLFRS
jgi:hypothetical protein